VDLAAQRLRRGGQRAVAVDRRAAGRPRSLRDAWQNAHSRRRKRLAPSTPAVGPLERLLGRAREHHEQPRGVGAVAVDQRLRVDAVVLGLGHRADAAVLDRASRRT
jgi:hypothetical protein